MSGDQNVALAGTAGQGAGVVIGLPRAKLGVEESGSLAPLRMVRVECRKDKQGNKLLQVTQ